MHRDNSLLALKLAAFIAIVLITLASNTKAQESAAQTPSDDADWTAFKERFKKNYTGPSEETYRLVQ